MKLTTLVMTTMLLGGQALAEQAKETPLLPAVKKMLAMSAIDQSKLDQNAYVYLLGLTAEGDNYQNEAKRMVLYTEALIREAVQKHKAELLLDEPDKNAYELKEAKPTLQSNINGKIYRFPCMSLANLNCVAEVIQQLPETKALATKNALYMKRYQQIIQLPYYDTYYFSMYARLPAYQYLFVLSGLRQTEAIEAINQGKIAKGLTILQEEIAFSKRMLAGQSYLIDEMIAIRLLMIQYHTLSELIDLPAMAKELDNPQFTALFKPLTTAEQQAMSIAYQKEAIATMQLYEAMDQHTVKLFWQKYMVEWQGKLDHKYPLTYDKNKTLNLYYDFFTYYIKLAQTTLPEAANSYTKLQQKVLADSKVLSQDEIYQQYGADNFFGGLTFEDGKASWGRYLYRLYDVSNYLALINAKLAIKQAHISKEQVPAFLERLGDKAQNPYSKTPFSWDEQTQILSSEWLAIPDVDIPTETYGTRARVKIVF